jgi:hypothetical protein
LGFFSGLDKIKQLLMQNDGNEEIYKPAYEIIDHYFSAEVGDFSATSAVIANVNLGSGLGYSVKFSRSFPPQQFQFAICNSCQCNLIHRRYKCLHYDDFHLCKRCEADGKHAEHAMPRFIDYCDMNIEV